MPLNRKPADRFESDRRTADATIRMQLQFVLSNLHHLRKVDKNGRMENAAVEFEAAIKKGEELTPGQRSYIDGIYEKTMLGAGLPAVNLHADRKKRGLKFG